MRARIHKFMLTLLERGEWDQVEAEVIVDLTKPDDRWTPRRLICSVCGRSMTEGVINWNYMLHNGIWAQAGFKPSDLAHIPCLESKLGRKLVQEDFVKCPMNSLIHWMFDNKIELPKD